MRHSHTTTRFAGWLARHPSSTIRRLFSIVYHITQELLTKQTRKGVHSTRGTRRTVHGGRMRRGASLMVALHAALLDVSTEDT